MASAAAGVGEPLGGVAASRVGSDAGTAGGVEKGCEMSERAVFEWLGWSPAGDSAVAVAMDRHFPHAVPGSALVSRATTVMRAQGVCKGRAILGTSICSDEINNEDGDLASQLREKFGQVFPMGGIGGAPFAGKTGFNAFSHHVPEDGHVVVLFGPHVGILKDGTIGEYLRDGQCCASTACGAVRAAYAQAAAGQCGVKYFDPDDVQQSWLRDKIAPSVDRIKRASEPRAELVHVAYRVIADNIEQIVHTDFGHGKLVLIGGIQINLPHPNEDHFMPLLFQIRQAGKAPVDLLDQLVLARSCPLPITLHVSLDQNDEPLPEKEKAPTFLDSMYDMIISSHAVVG